ncbi:unnamed protein product [Ectocarpus sp. 12 AP-2014]
MSGFETNHEEEQSMELEALEAIYADLFSIVSEKPLEWKVHLEPTEGGEGEVNHVGIDFTCRIPERYPDEAPGVEVEATKGLTPKQIEELQALAKTQAEENVGMAMGYTIAEGLKEWLADNNVPSAVDGSMHGEMLRRMAEGDRDRRKVEQVKEAEAKARAEDEEDDETIRRRRQIDGTPVTIESFKAWQTAFELEMRGGKAIAEEQVAKKPSGKEMFLRHLVAEEAEVAEGEEEDDVMVGDEGAFLDEEDLDDLSDDDDDDDDGA